MSAVPLCLNPPAGVPLKAGNGGARPRLLPPFRRFRAATRGCIRMRPEQGACSRRHPSLQLRSATYSPGHRFFRSDGFRQPIGCVSIFQFIFHQAVPVVNRRTPASAPTFKEKDPARTARGGTGRSIASVGILPGKDTADPYGTPCRAGPGRPGGRAWPRGLAGDVRSLTGRTFRGSPPLSRKPLRRCLTRMGTGMPTRGEARMPRAGEGFSPLSPDRRPPGKRCPPPGR